LHVAQKGNSAALCTIGKKRRRTRAEIEAARDGLAAQMNAQMEEELGRRTKSLRDSLAASEREAQSNRSAAQILTQFINNGQAYVDENGNVQLHGPNNIRNSDSQEQFNI
jgi:hypothetical protein